MNHKYKLVTPDNEKLAEADTMGEALDKRAELDNRGKDTEIRLQGGRDRK